MVMQKREFPWKNHTQELMIKFYPKLKNLSAMEGQENKCIINSIKNQVVFLSLHHKSRAKRHETSIPPENKYEVR